MDTITTLAIFMAKHIGLASILLPILVFAGLGYIAAAIANSNNK